MIAATHQPLEDMIAECRFRQDLYDRINTLRLSLPPLRERREDIAPLAELLPGRCLQRLNAEFDSRQTIAALNSIDRHGEHSGGQKSGPLGHDSEGETGGTVWPA